MPQFDYRAVNAQGEVTSGQMSGATEAAIITQLQAMGLIPISAQPQQEIGRAHV